METALKKAVARLKRDPSRPVEAKVAGLHVEIRAKSRRSAGDVFREIGPWEGETTDDLTRRLEEARRSGGTGERPDL